MTDIAIRTENLTRKFATSRAVSDVNITVQHGEVFGFLGPNGSGKTTVIKLLTGLLPLSGGNAWVDGIDVRKDPDAVREHIGYMSQKFSLYDDLTVMENLTFYGRIYGLRPDKLRSRIDDIISPKCAFAIRGAPSRQALRWLEAAPRAWLFHAA